MKDINKEKIEFGKKLEKAIKYIDSYEIHNKFKIQFEYKKAEEIISKGTAAVVYKFILTLRDGEYRLDKNVLERQVIISEKSVIGEKERYLKGNVIKWNPEGNILVVAFQSSIDYDRFPKEGYVSFKAYNVSYDIHEKAIDSLIQGTAVNKTLFDIILYSQYEKGPELSLETLNAQEKAVRMAVNTSDFLLVHGMPGTGKTAIINKIIKKLIAKREKVLICSKSNLTLDSILLKCIEQDVSCVRLGVEDSVEIPSVKNILIDRSVVSLQRKFIKNCCREELESVENISKHKEYIRITRDNIQNMLEFNEMLKASKKLKRSINLIEIWTQAFYSHKGLSMGFQMIINWVKSDNNANRQRVEDYREFLSGTLALNEKYMDLQKQYEEINYKKNIVKSKIDSAYKEVSGYKVFQYEGMERETLLARLEEEEKLLSKYSEKKTIIADLKESVEKKQESLYPILLSTVNVLGATTLGINNNAELINDLEFDTLIVDEAGQCHIFDILVPLSRAKKVILIGDIKGLQAESYGNQIVNMGKKNDEYTDEFIKGLDDCKELLTKSLLEILFCKAPADRKLILDTQYRMHPIISEFLSEQFYRERYKSGLKPYHREINLSKLNNPFYFIDTANSEERYESIVEEGGRNEYYNRLESKVIGSILTEIIKEGRYDTGSIGIITLYKRQKIEMERIIKEKLIKGFGLDEGEKLFGRLEIETVDSFYDREKDIIIYSFTRSNSEGEIGLLRDLRKLKVAMTRSRYLLIMLGDSKTLLNTGHMEARECFDKLIQYVKEKGVYTIITELH